MSTDSIVKQKSLDFAVRAVNLYRYLTEQQHEYVMSKQVLRSGTSIGANITEAIYGSSRRDFVAKLQIARKEAAETKYWLELLHRCGYIDNIQYQSLLEDCNEIMMLLTSTIKTCT